MLCALNKTANGHITKQFQNRTVRKSYTALLSGHVENDCGVFDYPIAKDVENFPLQKICLETGKPAMSRFQVVDRLENPDVTRVVFEPLTGRTHQLRIHSAYGGYPIVGCDLYADDIAFQLGERLMLHATALDFDHPVTSERISGKCPCPF